MGIKTSNVFLDLQWQLTAIHLKNNKYYNVKKKNDFLCGWNMIYDV